MNPPAYDYEEQIPAGYYDEIYRRGAGVRYFWHELKFSAVAAHLIQTKKLLDIGCGPGTFIGNYAGDANALGIDLSASQIDYACRHYASARHRFSAQSVASLIDAGEHFDTITMIELIEHLTPEEAVRLLTQSRQLLSPEGTLIVTTPNYASLWPVIETAVNLMSRVSYEAQHINKYRRGRLTDHLTEAGYGQVRVTTAVGLAPFAAVLGPKPARWLQTLEAATHNLGCGNLLLAVARP